MNDAIKTILISLVVGMVYACFNIFILNSQVQKLDRQFHSVDKKQVTDTIVHREIVTVYDTVQTFQFQVNPIKQIDTVCYYETIPKETIQDGGHTTVVNLRSGTDTVVFNPPMEAHTNKGPIIIYYYVRKPHTEK